MLVQNKDSCFIDSLEIAFGLPAHEIDAWIRRHFPDFDIEKEGYHPSVVQTAILELQPTGVSEIYLKPSVSGEPVSDCDRIVNRLSEWFSKPGFRCVAQGLDAGDKEHAIAFRDTYWYDPKNPEQPLEEPSIRMRSIWVLTLMGLKAAE